MNLQFGIALVLMGFLVIEAILVSRSRAGIPHRIVVTGTRGKTSLVRILAAGIRTAVPETWGKVTGDVPLLLAPDGTEHPLRRRSPARLHEQRGVLWRCRRKGSVCIVLESMTITPETMQAEMRLVRPTLVVLTNVRDDHRETLGSDPAVQRLAYLQAIPKGVPCISLDDFPQDGSVPEELLAMAETVLKELGWASPAASRAMRSVADSLIPGPHALSFNGSTVQLLDGFSANDPESLSRLWKRWRQDLQDSDAWPVLLATRADRPLRTLQFCDWLAGRQDVATVHVAGNHAAAATRLLKARGLKVEKFAGGAENRVVGDRAGGSQRVLVGIGNAKGLGLRLRSRVEGTVA